MVRPRARYKLVAAILAVGPLVALPFVLVRSVDPIARAAAAFVVRLEGTVLASTASAGLRASIPPDVPGGDLEITSARPNDSGAPASVRSAKRQSRAAVVARRAVRRIYVGPELIRKVVPVAGRPVATWVDRTADHPAGVVISRPGALAGTILPGDVLFEAEGTTLTSFDQVLSIVAARYERGARFLSGKVSRAGETWSVTVEPGWVIAPASSGR